MNENGAVVAAAGDVLNAFEAEFTDASVLSAVLLERDTSERGQPVTVAMAREILLDRDADPALSDRIWATLVRNYRRCSRRWQPVVIWMMVPYLRAITARLSHNWWWRVDVEDIRSEVIVGFLEALTQVDPDGGELGGHLWWRTFGNARRGCALPAAERPADDLDLIAARAADHSIDSTAEHGYLDGVAREPVDVPRDVSSIEGARLGALAQRLGLRDRALDRPRGRRSVRIVSVRGNRTDDAA